MLLASALDTVFNLTQFSTFSYSSRLHDLWMTSGPIFAYRRGAIIANPDARIGTQTLFLQGAAGFPAHQIKGAPLRAV